MSSDYVTRDKMRAAAVRRYTVTDVPNFGKVKLRSLTFREKRLIEAKRLGHDGMLDEDRYSSSFGWMCVFMIVEAEGPDENEPSYGEMDVEWLNDIDWGLAKPLYEAMNKHAELGPYSPSDDALKKNSKNGDCNTTSRGSSKELTPTA